MLSGSYSPSQSTKVTEPWRQITTGPLLVFSRNQKDHTDVTKFCLSVIFSCPLTLTHTYSFSALPC